jgi:hypothetical protein
VAVLAPAPTGAIPPPLPSYSRYGPVTQCLRGYRIAVTEAEAVTLGQGVTVLNDDFLLFLDPERTDRPATDVGQPVDVPGVGQALRYRVAADRGRIDFANGDREIIEYALPAIGGEGAVLVRSNRFDGSDGDLALLARVAPVDPARDRCGAFQAPDYAGQTPAALYWSPVQRPGPAFHCQGNIGVAIEAGETYQLNWSRDSAWARFVTNGVELYLRGPNVPARRYRRTRGPIEAGYDQNIRDMGGMSELLLTIPDARRPRDEPAHIQQIAVTYPNGQEAVARAFAARLEFVARDDRRCTRGMWGPTGPSPVVRLGPP